VAPRHPQSVIYDIHIRTLKLQPLSSSVQREKDPGEHSGAQKRRQQHGIWCALGAVAIGSYSFTSTLLPVDYPAQRPSPVQAPQVSLASLRN